MKNLYAFLKPASCAILFAISCAITLNAQAQTSDFVELIPTPYLQKDLTAIAGVGIVSLPKYADGSKQEILPLPILDLEWKSGVFFSTVSGFGYNFSQNPSWQYGVRLGLLSNQDQSEKDSKTGPGNIPTDLSPALFGNYLIDQHFSVLSSVQTGAGLAKQHDGFLVSLGGRYIDVINENNRVYGILSTTWASWHYMEDYYGVTQQQAAQYNFPEFETQAGMLKIKLAAGWNMTINKQWSLITGGSLTHPLGDSATSPVASSKTQVLAYTGVYYKF